MIQDRVDVGATNQLAPGTATVAVVGELPVAVFNLRGELYAVDGLCIRCGASLARGIVGERDVVCECGWGYDIMSGTVCELPALRIDRFRVDIIDGRIVVDALPLR